jgi:hypothetical protein
MRNVVTQKRHPLYYPASPHTMQGNTSYKDHQIQKRSIYVQCNFDGVRNDYLLHRVKDSNILHTLKISEANWLDHVLRRSCLLKHIIDGMMQGGI